MKDRDALFDFDESFNNLSEVSEKYAAEPETITAIDLNSQHIGSHNQTIKSQVNMNESLKEEVIKELTYKKEKRSRESGLKNGLDH